MFYILEILFDFGQRFTNVHNPMQKQVYDWANYEAKSKSYVQGN